MKKVLLSAIFFILLGFFLGDFIFGEKKDLLKKVKNTESYYFLEEGVYPTENSLQNNIMNISKKVIEKKENRYYVYIGITKDKKVLEKLKEIYKRKGIKVIEKEKNVSSKEFLENVTQFDLLIRKTEEEEEILTIEEVVLANYNEITKNQ